MSGGDNSMPAAASAAREAAQAARELAEFLEEFADRLAEPDCEAEVGELREVIADKQAALRRRVRSARETRD